MLYMFSSFRWLAWTISYVNGKVPKIKRGQAPKQKCVFKPLLSSHLLMSRWPTRAYSHAQMQEVDRLHFFMEFVAKFCNPLERREAKDTRNQKYHNDRTPSCFASFLFSLYPVQSIRPTVFTIQWLWSHSALGLTSSLHHNLRGRYSLVLDSFKKNLRLKVIGLICILKDEDRWLSPRMDFYRWKQSSACYRMALSLK